MDRKREPDEKPISDLAAIQTLQMNTLDVKPENDLVAIA